MLHCIKNTTVRLWNDESGASLLEYSVLIGLIIAGVVTSIVAVANLDGRSAGPICLYNTLNHHQ